MAERKVTSVQGLLATFEISLNDRGVTKKATFTACKDAASFKPYVAGLADGPGVGGKPSPLDNVYGLYIAMADLKARAQERVVIASESTIIKRDGREIDLLKLSNEKAVGAVNMAYGLAFMTGTDAPAAFIATMRKLVESGRALASEPRKNDKGELLGPLILSVKK